MLTIQKQKEELSIAYIHAITAYAGFALVNPRIDIDSVDATIRASGQLEEDSILHSPEINIQLKATSAIRINPTAEEFVFPLPIKNYNELKSPKVMVPKLLIVLKLPEEQNFWLSHSVDNLSLRRCAYWLNLTGKPDVSNTTTINVHIPTANVFSPDALKDIMKKVAKEEHV